MNTTGDDMSTKFYKWASLKAMSTIGVHPDTLSVIKESRQSQHEDSIRMSEVDKLVKGNGDDSVKLLYAQAMATLRRLKHFLDNSKYPEDKSVVQLKVPGSVLTNVDLHDIRRALGNLLNRAPAREDEYLRMKKRNAQLEKKASSADKVRVADVKETRTERIDELQKMTRRAIKAEHDLDIMTDKYNNLKLERKLIKRKGG